MPHLIEGRTIAEKVYADLRVEIANLKKSGRTPGLAVVLVGDNPASRAYVRSKDKMCKDLGLAVDAARGLRVPVFVAPAAQQLYRLASSHGLGRKDFTSVYTLLKPSTDTAPV